MAQLHMILLLARVEHTTVVAEIKLDTIQDHPGRLDIQTLMGTLEMPTYLETKDCARAHIHQVLMQ